MSSTCFSQSPVPLALLLTVAAAQCKENSLSLYTNTKTKANISIAVSPSALHNNTSTQSKHKSQRVVSQPLQTNYSGVYSYRRCMAVRYMQTKIQKRKTRKQERSNRGRFQLFFHHPFIGCAYQGVKQGAKQCAGLMQHLQTCMHLARVAGNKASTHGLQASF